MTECFTRVIALLVSTYELGHQPFGLASPAAWLRRDGVDVRTIDLAKDKLADADVRAAGFIGFHLAMHTATRLAAPVIRRARALNPSARICAYGLYAPLNEEWLRSLGVNHVLGGEFEAALASLAREPRAEGHVQGAPPALPKLRFLVPHRGGLPPLSRYASLTLGDGTRRTVGYTEASRGCRHLCRHCPIVPVYNGEFRVVQPEVVLADVEAQVAAGAEHITFGDPDFFNGPTHAMRIVDALHARHPSVTYDATIKIEHLLEHRSLLPQLQATGCLFVTSAVESVNDRVLAALDKGHTRQDFIDAARLCRAAGVTLTPTFVAFHPWLTLEEYCDLVDTIEQLGLVAHVAPIQLAIRLLIPRGSRLLELEDIARRTGPFDPDTLAYPWAHEDPRVDALHKDVTAIVGSRLTADRAAVFNEISDHAHQRAGIVRAVTSSPDTPARVPFMSEPWYCCAEPNPDQLRIV